MFGLIERDLKYIKEAASHYTEIDKVILFGSRAMGNHKKGSDVDIALVGENITRTTLNRLSDELNEVYPLPYYFDILDYGSISNDQLIKHIDTEGKVIYVT